MAEQDKARYAHAGCAVLKRGVASSMPLVLTCNCTKVSSVPESNVPVGDAFGTYWVGNLI